MSQIINATPTDAAEFLSASEATGLIGCSTKQLWRLAADRRIGTWSLPGGRARYLRSDCERVRDSAYCPAVA